MGTLGALASGVGGRFVNDFAVTGSEAQRAFQSLEARFPELQGETIPVVVRADDGIADRGVRNRIEEMLEEMRDTPHVVGVLDPYGPLGTVSDDGSVALAQVQMDALGPDVDTAAVDALIEIAERHRAGDFQVELGGPLIQIAETGFVGGSEGVGLAAAVIILLVTFGSVTAMSVPIMVAALGLGAGLAGVTLLTHVVGIFTFAPPLAMMVGLGVGNDYALFIVTRYRQGLADGMSPEDATATAMGTAGRAVVFAGTTVVISVLGMVLMGLSFANGMAYSTALVVALTVIAAITATPAALGFVGNRIDSLRLPIGRKRSAGESASWHRWSALVQRHRWRFLAAGVIPLLVLAVPLLAMRLGGPQFGGDNTSFTTRRAYDLVSEAFGPGTNGPLLLVAELDNRTRDLAALEAVVERATALGARRGIPVIVNQAGDTAVATIIPATAPHAEETEQLVDRIRDEIVPAATVDTGTQIRVGGVTALFIDMSTLVTKRLPLFIAGVLLLSFLLLMAVFRSLLIPVKAVIANLLSIGAAYGLVVAVFQWGWLNDLVGIDRTGPIMAFLPMMLFAILFGLSMDYEVFLMSRIQEEYGRTPDAQAAISNGLAGTARVITAAAAIMVTVFLSFVLGEDRIIKTFGLGLATAVLIDATVVRMLIVPAALSIFGRAAWWLPGPVDRLLPRLAIDGAEPSPPSPEVASPSPSPITEVRPPAERPMTDIADRTHDPVVWDLENAWLISADNHVSEPLDLWMRLPGELAPLAPHIEERDGVPSMVVEGKVIQRLRLPEGSAPDPSRTGDVLAAADRAEAMSMMVRDANDPLQRVRDLDRDSIWGEVMFPNLFVFMTYRLSNPRLQAAACSVYNDWVWDTFGAHERFMPVAPLPALDIDAAVAELERCARRGFKVVLLPAHSDWLPQPYNAPVYDRLWSAAQDHGLPIHFHAGTGRTNRPAHNPGGAVINYVVTVQGPSETVVYLAGSGVLARHPRLKVVMVECGSGWLAWTLHAMDDAYREHEMWVDPKLEDLPSEYFRRQGYVTFQHDPVGFHNVSFTGDRCLMWGADYPHPEGTWPESKRYLRSQLAGVSPETARRVLWDNAAELYGWETPKAPPPAASSG
ncbi:MAG: MMPL family transporter [Acidimicrobiales bacterium]|nr:MMPL family transporter [Acidimicrobiales bacterium]